MPFDMICDYSYTLTVTVVLMELYICIVLYANKTRLAVMTTDRIESNEVDFESTVAGPSFGF
jgi:hypothetical protein